MPGGKAALYGQELNAQTWALCTMNMFLHGVDDARIWQGDTLSNPQDVEDDHLMDSSRWWWPIPRSAWTSGTAGSSADAVGGQQGQEERCPRSWIRTTASTGAFLPPPRATTPLCCTCCPAWTTENGRMAVVLPHGVLFRGASEGKIRRQLVEMQPAGCRDRPARQPVLRHRHSGLHSGVQEESQPVDDVLFIDASGEGNFEKGKNQNILRDTRYCPHRQRLQSAGERWTSTAMWRACDEIKENDFNLNIPRYVDTFEEEELVDIDEVTAEHCQHRGRAGPGSGADEDSI